MRGDIENFDIVQPAAADAYLLRAAESWAAGKVPRGSCRLDFAAESERSKGRVDNKSVANDIVANRFVGK